MKDYTDIIQGIRGTFGDEKQAYKAVEELKELIDAVVDAIPAIGNEGEIEHIQDPLIDEIADVEIMLTQLKSIFGITDEDVIEAKINKLDRTLQRIKEGYYII